MMKIANPIRLFAVLCVAVTSGFVMWMSYRLLNVLSGPGWCATAFGAGKVAGTEPVKGLDACVGMLTIQLKSLATNSYIFGGVIALCLLTLIVIVIAGAKLDLKANKDGIDLGLSRDAQVKQAAAAGAQAATDSAQETTDQITKETP